MEDNYTFSSVTFIPLSVDDVKVEECVWWQTRETRAAAVDILTDYIINFNRLVGRPLGTGR
jgi:hypothetical protein